MDISSGQVAVGGSSFRREVLVGKKNCTHVVFSAEPDAGTGKTGMPAALGESNGLIEAQTSFTDVGLHGADKEGLVRVHVIPA